MARKVYNLKDALKNPEEVEELSMHGLGLKEIPSEISQLKNLKVLRFGMNKLSQIPKEIETLSKLEELDLSVNQLTDINFDFSKLPFLKELYLFSNEIKHLPDSICTLTCLEELKAGGNLLNGLPIEFKQLKKLQSLSLSRNLFKKFPVEAIQIQNLKNFCFWGNAIKEFPIDISNWTSLTSFEMNNEVSEPFLTELFKLKELQTLAIKISSQTNFDICYNKSKPQNIQFLKIIGDKESSIPQTIFHFSELTNLDISKFNDQATLSEIKSLKKLKYLTLSELPNLKLTTSISTLEKLEHLSVTKTPINNVLDAVLCSDNIRRLYLNLTSFNSIESERVSKFIQVVKSQNFPKHLRKSAYQISKNDLSNLSNLSKKELFTVLNLRFRQLERNTLNFILQNLSQSIKNYPLKPDIHLALLGKTNFNFQRVKSYLKHTTQKITHQTTHIFLGKLPNEIENLSTRDFVFVCESELNLWLQEQENPYLLSSSKEEIANLSRLLLSLQVENIDIALQIMTSGGVPTILLTDLVIAFKKLPACKQKRAIRKLLSLNLSEKALKVVSLKTGLLKKNVLGATILKMTANTVLNGEKIVEYM